MHAGSACGKSSVPQTHASKVKSASTETLVLVPVQNTQLQMFDLATVTCPRYVLIIPNGWAKDLWAAASRTPEEAAEAAFAALRSSIPGISSWFTNISNSEGWSSIFSFCAPLLTRDRFRLYLLCESCGRIQRDDKHDGYEITHLKELVAKLQPVLKVSVASASKIHMTPLYLLVGAYLAYLSPSGNCSLTAHPCQLPADALESACALGKAAGRCYLSANGCRPPHPCLNLIRVLFCVRSLPKPLHMPACCWTWHFQARASQHVEWAALLEPSPRCAISDRLKP